MISIQDLGISILSDSPKPLYFIGGDEYGVKQKYIAHLMQLYGEKVEYGRIADVATLMNSRHLIPLKPKLYIVRYDEVFVSQIQSLSTKLKPDKIIGTLVCLYSDSKHIDKIDKYFPEYTGVIDAVNPKFIEKYLTSDFPELDAKSIHLATQISANYSQALNVCRSLSNANPAKLAAMTEGSIAHTFGYVDDFTDNQFQHAVASRNFVTALRIVDGYQGDLDTLVYSILQTMIEMEKVLTSKYSNSEFNNYKSLWKLEDVFYLFDNAYHALAELRSNTATNAYSTIVYLLGLFTFATVPSKEVMHES